MNPPPWLDPVVRALDTIEGSDLTAFLPPEDHDARVSAVLVLFGEGETGPDLLLTERSHTMRSHPGQVSFPGGGLDPGEGPHEAALREAYEEVFEEFDRVIGLPHLRLFHLNDSQKPFASKRDRHAGIGEGTLGEEPFRRIMNDPRFAWVPKVLETPKGEDLVTADLANLGRLRGYLAAA